MIGQKRPAEESNKCNDVIKRAAKDNADDEQINITSLPHLTPLMSQDEAEKIIKSVKLPKQSKKQSHYMRFKSIMLKEAKKQGDTQTINDITSVAKDAWKWVKDYQCEVKPLQSSDKDANIETDITKSESKFSRFVRLKRLAIQEEKAEMHNFDEKLDTFKSNYLEAAIAATHWKTAGMNKINCKSFESQVNSIHLKVMTAWGEGSDFPPKVKEKYNLFKDKLNAILKEVASEELVSKLQHASREVLLDHVQEFHDLQVQAKELEELKAKSKAFQAKKQRELERDLASAHKIKPEICRNLKKLMVYTDSSLKSYTEQISFSKNGVSPEVFADAFEVPRGTKEVTFPGSDIGSKALRYGYLKCSKVIVKLDRNYLTASTSYMIH